MGRPRLGKLSPAVMEAVVLAGLGAHHPGVRVGPRTGCDNAVVDLGHGQVLIATTDPLWAAPELGMETSARLAAHLVASDLATSGVAPQFALVELNLPEEMDDAGFTQYWQGLHRAFTELGVAVVGGHTGRYAGCHYTIVGGASLLAVAPEDGYVTPAMAGPGDRIVLTKGAAIEATGVLATVFARHVRERLGAEVQARAAALLQKTSTVRDAQVAASIGLRERGVTAMHDTTEGGILGGLAELVAACGAGARIDLCRVPVDPAARRVMDLFGLDPLEVLSEGTLLITVRPDRMQALLGALAHAEIPAAEVGTLLAPQAGAVVEDHRGIRPLTPPAADRYWEAYRQAQAGGWA